MRRSIVEIIKRDNNVNDEVKIDNNDEIISGDNNDEIITRAPFGRRGISFWWLHIAYPVLDVGAILWSNDNTLQCSLVFIHISPAKSPLNHFYTWCNMLLTGLHHSTVVSISPLLLSNYSMLPLHLPPLLPSPTCTRINGNHHHHHAYKPIYRSI